LREELEKMSTKLGPTIADLAMETGEKKGEQKGRREGQLAAFREILRESLQDRFGALPKAVLERIENTIDLDILRTARRQVASLKILDDLHL